MSTNFPTSLDTFPTAAALATQTLGSTPHSQLHANLGDAVAALEVKLGVNSSAVTAAIDYLIHHITETLLALTDVTTANASTARHGFCPKGDNNSTHFLNGQLGWTVPSGGSPGGSDTYVQFNNGGNFSGEAALAWDKTNKILTVSAPPTSGNGLVVAAGSSRFAYLVYNDGVVVSAAHFTDGTQDVTFCDGTCAISVAAGAVKVPGTSGNTVRWGAGAAAPSTQTLISLPLNVYGSGTITGLLGTPDGWVLVNIAGTNYKVPCYL